MAKKRYKNGYYQGWINYNMERIEELKDRILCYCNGSLDYADRFPDDDAEITWNKDIDSLFKYEEKARSGIRLTKEEMLNANRMWKEYAPPTALGDLPSLRDLRDQINNYDIIHKPDKKCG